MAWTIEYTDTARKQLHRLGKSIARRIVDFLDERLANRDDPRSLGKALTGPLGKLWRYCVGDYRIVCEVRDESLIVLGIRIGHRRQVYR